MRRDKSGMEPGKLVVIKGISNSSGSFVNDGREYWFLRFHVGLKGVS